MEIMINLSREEAEGIRDIFNEVTGKEVVSLDKDIRKGTFCWFQSSFIGTRHVTILQVNNEAVKDILDLFKKNTDHMKNIIHGATIMTQGYIDLFVSFIKDGADVLNGYLKDKKAA